MTTKTRPTTSGHCQAADQQPVPTAAHARCRLDGCACRCHAPAPRLKVSFACLTGAHDGCHGFHPGDVEVTSCGCPDPFHATTQPEAAEDPWDQPSHPLRDLEAAVQTIIDTDRGPGSYQLSAELTVTPGPTQLGYTSDVPESLGTEPADPGPAHNHAWTPRPPDVSDAQYRGTVYVCPCGALMDSRQVYEPDALIPAGVQLAIPVDPAHLETWPESYVPADWLPARGLTQDERRRVIAAHLIHRPEAILETVAEIVAERTAK